MKFVHLHPRVIIQTLDSNESTKNIEYVFSMASQAFISGIDVLKRLDNAPLSELASYAQRLFESKFAEFTLGGVTTLTTATIALSDSGAGYKEVDHFIICPPDWNLKISENPFFEFGALVYCLSQVIDCYNGVSDNIKERSLAFEAEYLLGVPEEKLNKYQRNVLQAYPNGFNDKFLYKRKQVGILN